MSTKGSTVQATTKAKTQSKDAPRGHDQPQKKQLSLEAQRISTILEKCISRVEIAAILPAALRLNSVSSVGDKELSRTLQEHQMLTERLEMLEDLKMSDGEHEGEASRRVRAQLEGDFKDSVRDLFRLLRAHPDAISGLKAEIGMEVRESEHILIRVLKKFHSHMVEKLLTSVDEELQLILHKQLSSPPVHYMKNLTSLEEAMVINMKEIDAKISQKDHEIKTLQSSLQRENTQEADMLLLAERQHQSLIKTSKVKQSSIQQEINQLNIQLNNLILENRQAERILQEKNEKVETEIEYLLQNFDDEIGENQANLELNEIDHGREEEELRKLEKPFSVLEVECNQILEKRRLAEEKRKEEMKELELKTKAAILAQAWWRGYSVRKALKNKGKNKKAKKGKGKKSK